MENAIANVNDRSSEEDDNEYKVGLNPFSDQIGKKKQNFGDESDEEDEDSRQKAQKQKYNMLNLRNGPNFNPYGMR